MSYVPESFYDLFEGRTDALGLLQGGCRRTAVSIINFTDHLYLPECSIGVYPLLDSPKLEKEWGERMGGPVPGYFVKWGCSDIDNKGDPEATWVQAYNLRAAFKVLGITAWIERTKSKGHHVWVFADEFIPAVAMRRAFLFAHQVAGVAATEVNPKQIELKAVGLQFGNYVNLPYPYGYVDRRIMIEDPKTGYPLADFVHRAMKRRASWDSIYSVAKLYKEPPKKHVVLGEPSGEAKELSAKLPGLAWTIFEKGPLEGRDRSGTLQRFAHLCSEADIEAADTLVMLRDADSRWGKFSDRRDGEMQLASIVERAYR